MLQLVQVLQECDHSTHIELISITLAKKDLILQKLGGHCSSGQKMCVVNLCDGTELDGYPVCPITQPDYTLDSIRFK